MAEIIIKGRILPIRFDMEAYKQLSEEVGNILELQ